MALGLLAALLYLAYGLLEYYRRLVMLGAASRIEELSSGPLIDCRIALVRQGGNHDTEKTFDAMRGLADYYRSPVATAFYDVPWSGFFILALFILHPLLGSAGAVALVISSCIAYGSYRAVQMKVEMATQSSLRVQNLERFIDDRPGLIRAQGIRAYITRAWTRSRSSQLRDGFPGQRIQYALQAASKASKQVIQSGMLAIGAILVIAGQLDPGAMIVGSLLVGRAIGPIEIIIGQLSVLQKKARSLNVIASAVDGRRRLPDRKPMPKPDAQLVCRIDRGRAPGSEVDILRNIEFELEPGHCVGVIGRGGAGKSVLLKHVSGIWPIALGSVRLGATPIDQFSEADTASWVGVMTDEVHLFPGTLADNIAASLLNYDMEDVKNAAWTAGIHDRIVAMDQGYGTDIEAAVSLFSRGDLQLLMFARAIFRWPVFLVLDEPTAHLDDRGCKAVLNAVEEHCAEGGIAIISSNRPPAVTRCTHLLTLEQGQQLQYARKDELLRPKAKGVELTTDELPSTTVRTQETSA